VILSLFSNDRPTCPIKDPSFSSDLLFDRFLLALFLFLLLCLAIESQRGEREEVDSDRRQTGDERRRGEERKERDQSQSDVSNKERRFKHICRHGPSSMAVFFDLCLTIFSSPSSQRLAKVRPPS